mgnify:CR=1 FL=1
MVIATKNNIKSFMGKTILFQWKVQVYVLVHVFNVMDFAYFGDICFFLLMFSSEAVDHKRQYDKSINKI